MLIAFVVKNTKNNYGFYRVSAVNLFIEALCNPKAMFPDGSTINRDY